VESSRIPLRGFLRQRLGNLEGPFPIVERRTDLPARLQDIRLVLKGGEILLSSRSAFRGQPQFQPAESGPAENGFGAVAGQPWAGG